MRSNNRSSCCRGGRAFPSLGFVVVVAVATLWTAQHPVTGTLAFAGLRVFLQHPTTTRLVTSVQQQQPAQQSWQTCRPLVQPRPARRVGLLFASSKNNSDKNKKTKSNKDKSSSNNSKPKLERVNPDLEGIPIPFIDTDGSAFIECYADSVTVIDGVEYTIGVPCDHCVALTYWDPDAEGANDDDDDEEEEGALIPVELNSPLMDDIFPICEAIVADEFGEELVLQRTPQTLTLVGELETNDDEEDDEDDDEEEDEDEEEVEVLLSFEHRDKEYNLVRLLDPILLVGKKEVGDDDDEDAKRYLLSAEESERIMSVLEDLFLEYHQQQQDQLNGNEDDYDLAP